VIPLLNKIKQLGAPAIRSLGKINDERAVELLIAIIDSGLEQLPVILEFKRLNPNALSPVKSDWSDSLIASAEALGDLGNLKAIDPLTKMVQSQNWSFRKTAARSLQKLDWKPRNYPVNIHYWMALDDWERCADYGPKAISPIIAALEIHGCNRGRAAKTLGQIGDKRAIEPLTKIVYDYPKGPAGPAHSTVAEQYALTAIHAIGIIGGSEGAWALTDIIKWCLKRDGRASGTCSRFIKACFESLDKIKPLPVNEIVRELEKAPIIPLGNVKKYAYPIEQDLEKLLSRAGATDPEEPKSAPEDDKLLSTN
jgi:hypothetical protein